MSCCLAAALLLVGCGDGVDAGSSDGGGTTSATASGGGGATASGGGGGSGGAGVGPICPAPEPKHENNETYMDWVEAVYIDQLGKPAADVMTTICALNGCGQPVVSDADGKMKVFGTGKAQYDYRFNVGYRSWLFAKLVAVIPTSPSHDFGVVRVIRLAPFEEGAVILAGQQAMHGGVSLELEAGASVIHDGLVYDEDQRGLRGAVVNLADFEVAQFPVLDPSLDLQVLISVMPNGTHICPAAKLGFDNVAGWPAGMEVDLYINGNKTFEHHAPYGLWAQVSDAVVSEDAAEVVTKDGQGVELLGTFAATPKK